MNVLEMSDIQIYERGLEILTKNLGLAGTTRFLRICKPRKGDAAEAWQSLSQLEMESLREKVFQAYTPKPSVAENGHIRNLDMLPDMAFYQIGLEAILDELGTVGMARFTRIRNPITTDYTAERHKWLDKLDKVAVLAGIQQVQQEYLAEQAKAKK